MVNSLVTAGGITTTVIVTPVVSTTPAYTAGDSIGGKLTLTKIVDPRKSINATPSAVPTFFGSGIIQSIVLVDQAKQSLAVDILFFNSDPSATTFTDNAVLDVADADLLKAIGHVSILAADYTALNDNSLATKTNLGIAFNTTGSTTLYAAIIARGTPTFAATNDLQLMTTVLGD